MYHKALIIGLFLLGAMKASAQIVYPGAKLPGEVPQLFAEGLISDELGNRDFTISPDGTELFFTTKLLTTSIIHVRKEGGKWGKAQIAPFSGKYRDLEASFSPDGKTIYFASDRPVVAGVPKKDFDLWKVTKLPNGQFGEPENLGTTVNTDKNEFYPSIAKNGNLYFTVAAAYGKGDEDIVVCTRNGSGYNKPESLSEAINTTYGEFNAFVDPDEQFILFSSFGRADDIGRGDIYISKKDKEGKWIAAKHLPSPINSNALDYCPYITPDKKYLIFTSNRMSAAFADTKETAYDKLKALLNKPGNGQDDLYWVKFNPEQ